MLSHTYVKKINLSLPKSLSQKKNLDVVCVVPKKIFQGENIVYPDYKKNEIKIKLIESNLVNKSMRFQYFENIDKVIEKHQPNIIFWIMIQYVFNH